jgi:hypothetical protein
MKTLTKNCITITIKETNKLTDFNTTIKILEEKYMSVANSFSIKSTTGLNPSLTLIINKTKGGSATLKDIEKMTTEELITQVEKLIK